MCFFKTRVTRVTRVWLWVATFFALTLFCGAIAYAQLPTTVDESSVALTYNDIAGQRGWGVLAATPYEMGMLKGYTAAIAQKGGTLLRSKYHAEVGISHKNWDFNLYTNGLVKQYEDAEAGRVSGIGLAVEAPERDVGVFHVTAGLGVEGQNAGQIGAPNAGDTLEALGYDTEVLESLGLYSLNPAPTGLTIKQGNALKALLYAELLHPSGLVISLKGLPEISGSESPVHQLVVSGSMSFEFGENISLEVGADLGLQTFDGEFEKELATFGAVKLSY